MNNNRTVNKIIKDLNFYRGQKLFEFNGKKPEIYIHDIIDVINHQKAEIEKLWICVDELKKEVGRHERNYDPSDETQKIIKKIMGKDGTKKVRGKIKAEAYKEFAERLKNEIINDTAYACDSTQHSGYYDYQIKIGDIPEYIDNLVKEMEGDSNE